MMFFLFSDNKDIFILAFLYILIILLVLDTLLELFKLLQDKHSDLCSFIYILMIYRESRNQ